MCVISTVISENFVGHKMWNLKTIIFDWLHGDLNKLLQNYLTEHIVIKNHFVYTCIWINFNDWFYQHIRWNLITTIFSALTVFTTYIWMFIDMF